MQSSRREKQMLIGALVILALFVGFRLIVKPAADRLGTLGRVVPEKEAELALLRSKSQEYLTLEKELGDMREGIAGRRSDFRLLSFLEAIERECGLTRNVASMKPDTIASPEDTYVETRIEVKLENVSLRQITDFLLRIETSEAPIGVNALRIRTAAKSATLLDATVHLASLTLSEAE